MNARSSFVIDLDRERKRRNYRRPAPPPIGRLLTQAERWKGELDRGEVRNHREIARREGLSVGRVGHILELLTLHPDVRTAIAALPREESERKVWRLLRLPPEAQVAGLAELLKRSVQKGATAR